MVSRSTSPWDSLDYQGPLLVIHAHLNEEAEVGMVSVVTTTEAVSVKDINGCTALFIFGSGGQKTAAHLVAGMISVHALQAAREAINKDNDGSYGATICFSDQRDFDNAYEICKGGV